MGTGQPEFVASLNEVDILVTDDELPSGIREMASEKVGEIIVAEGMPTARVARS